MDVRADYDGQFGPIHLVDYPGVGVSQCTEPGDFNRAPLSVLAAFYLSLNLVLLLLSYAMFTVVVAPATFGWVAFMYVPSLLLLTGVVIFTLISRAVTLIRRFVR